MEKITRFKSVLEPDKFGYEFTSDGGMANWNRRGNHDLLNPLTKFHTYGDGSTQHSGAWCVQAADATDAMLSLATAILADSRNEIWQNLQWPMNPVCRESIAFAFSVKFKEGKDQFYSLELRKLTSSDKRNDRRFEKVNQYQDGTYAGAMQILCQSHWDFLQWLACSDACLSYAQENNLSYPMRDEIDPVLSKMKGDWHQAFRALQQAVSAVVALAYAERICHSCAHNSRPQVIAPAVETATQQAA